MDYIKNSKLNDELKKWALQRNKTGKKLYKRKTNVDFFLTLLIYCQLIHPRENPRFKKKDLYFSIYHEYFEHWLGKSHYKKYQEIFEKAGILEINPKYKNSSDGDGFPMSFRLTKKFRKNTNQKDLVVIRQRPHAKNKQKCVREAARGHKKDSEKPLTPLESFLKNNFLDLQFDIEQFNNQKDSIKKAIFDNYEERMQKWARILCETWGISDNDCQLPYDSYIKHDPKTGRVYSAFIEQPKQLRPFFKLREENLAEIDVSACYAYLLNLFYSHPAFKSVTDKYSPEDIQLEKNRYSEPWKTQNVDFYVFLGSLMKSKKHTRTQIKEGFNQKFLNVKSTTDIGKEIQNVFRTQFPILLEILNHIKTTYVLDQFGVSDDHKKKSMKKLHGQVSIILTRFESSVMIDKIAQNAMHNAKFIVTIHDGILVQPCDIDYFQTLITNEFTQMVGLPPHLKVKLLES
jgi:hypothetical protein